MNLWFYQVRYRMDSGLQVELIGLPRTTSRREEVFEKSLMRMMPLLDRFVIALLHPFGSLGTYMRAIFLL